MLFCLNVIVAPSSGHGSMSSVQDDQHHDKHHYEKHQAHPPVEKELDINPVLLQKAPMNIRFPLENAWSNGQGVRTPRSARSTASSRAASPMYDHMVVTSEED